jgi:glycosyltransferase involved in cell wall biosynthesis
MKILLVNKFHFVKGGADRHYLELADLLRSKGYEVIFFSMQHANNFDCKQKKYFIKYLDFSQIKFDKYFFKKITRMMWSREAQTKLQSLVTEEKPDIAHLHNIYHQISPSILKILKRNDIPIVMTVHDYYLVSPLYSLFTKNKIFDPKRWQYWKIAIQRAIKNSFGASAFSSLIHAWHKYMGYYGMIDIFISPSHFLATRLGQAYPKARIEVLPNFVKTINNKIYKPDNYFLFAGRLINEKGIELFLQVAQKLSSVQFQIAGTGPDEDRLRKEYDLANVTWLGQLDNGSLQDKIQSARAMIVPSIWYENCPLIILESFAFGTPVVASRIGGIPEIVRHEHNGLLFNNNDIDDLCTQICRIDSDNGLHKDMSWGAKESALKYSEEEYYKKLLKLYESI